jgi:hypothetical protein
MEMLFPSVLESEHLRPFWFARGGSLGHRVEAASLLLQNRNLRTLMSLAWENLFGAADMILLKLDLGSFRSEHLRRFALTARPVEARDMADFFDLDADGLSGQERRDAAARLFKLRAGIQTCYVVEDSSRKACFLQWLIPFSENEKLHRVYGKWYPDLQPDEAIIEHAYMLPSHRGKGLFPCATAKVLEIAREAGMRSIVTFVPTWNKNSLNSIMRLGFAPYMLRSDRKFFALRYRKMSPLGANARIPGSSQVISAARANRLVLERYRHVSVQYSLQGSFRPAADAVVACPARLET